MKSFLNEKQATNRKCGDCTACCSRLRIKELNKEINVDCSFLCKTGCSIYNKRPEVCRNFQCVWLVGWAGGESHRPDKLGIMFSMWEHNSENVLHAWELWPKAFEDDKARRILTEIGQQISFVAVKYEGKMALIGTPKSNSRFRSHHLNRKIFSIRKGLPLEQQLIIITSTECNLPNLDRNLTDEEKEFLEGLIQCVLEN